MKYEKLIEDTGLTNTELAEALGVNERTIRRYQLGETAPAHAVRTLMEKQVKYHSRKKSKGEFKFIDLFAGIGGMRKAFDNLGGECVFTSEWNKYSRQTYRVNFPTSGHHFAGDITQVHESDIPQHDLLVAGFPCQPFSLAGVSKKNSLDKPHGFLCETQGTLFFDVARIIKFHRPKAFLLENVKNLVSHDKGNTFKVIKQTLEVELGYHIDFKVIDAKGYVPQHRERIFIIGTRENAGLTFDNLKISDQNFGPRLSDILHPEDGSEGADPSYLDVNGHVLSKYTLSDKLWEYLKNYAQKHRENGNGFGFGLVGPNDIARTLSARYHKDGSEILVEQPGKNPRRLTPRECARLMGFEHRGGEKFGIPVSDTQAYRQFGNAVVVPVVESVGRLLLPYLISTDQVKENNKMVYGQAGA